MGWIEGRHLWSKWLRMDLEKARGYRNVLAVLTILGAAAGLGLAVRQLLPSPAFAQQNFAIVLDRSAAMAASFDGQSKLEAAKDKVRDQLKGESSRYSLATRQADPADRGLSVCRPTDPNSYAACLIGVVVVAFAP